MGLFSKFSQPRSTTQTDVVLACVGIILAGIKAFDTFKSYRSDSLKDLTK